MSEDTLFELADRRDRHETAALLRKLATDLDGGRELAFDDVALGVPETLDVELEVEVEESADGPDEYEVEIELDWDGDAVVEAAAIEGDDESEGEGDAEERPASGEEGESPPETESESESESETEPRPAVARPEVEHVEQGPTARASPPEEEPLDAAEELTAEEPASTESGEGVEPDPGTPLARFQVYRDRGGKWRWRLVHRNGNVIASSGQGYTTRRNAEKGMRSVMQNAPGATVEREGESETESEDGRESTAADEE